MVIVVVVVVLQQWLARTTATGVDARDRRRLDLVIYGVSPWGEALCRDATLVSRLARPGASEEDGAALSAGGVATEASNLP